jgi:hypothetical protein
MHDELDNRKRPTRTRTSLKPVENTMKDYIISTAESQWLSTVLQSFEDPRFIAIWNSLADSEKQKLKGIVKIAAASIKSKTVSELKEIQAEKYNNYAKWDIIEKIEDMDSRNFRLMINMGCAISTEEAKIIKWNPVEKIKKYRRSVDPLRHLHFPMDFYAKVLAKSGISLETLPQEILDILKKAFNTIKQYRKQFSNKKRYYTWYEWFWIVRYAQVETSRLATNMLETIDGKINGKYPIDISTTKRSLY